MKKLILFIVILLGVVTSVQSMDTVATTRLWSSGQIFDDAIFSHDGRYLYASGRSKSPIIKFDALTGQILDTLESDFSSHLFYMNILPGDSILVFLMEIGFYNGSCNVPVFYNLRTDTYKIYDSTYLFNRVYNRGLMFNKPYSKYAVLTYKPETNIKIYNATTHQKTIEIAYETQSYLGFLGWTSDSTLLCANCNKDDICRLELYNVNTGQIQAYGNRPYYYGPPEITITEDNKKVLIYNDFFTSDSLKHITEIDSVLQDGRHLFGGSILDKTGRYIFFQCIDGETRLYDIQLDKVICFASFSWYGKKLINDSNNLLFEASGVYRINWDFITDVPEEMKTTDSKVFPNPCDDYISIQSDNHTESIEIYNTMGEMILQSPMTDKIDVSNFPMGLYFIKTGSKIDKFVKK